MLEYWLALITMYGLSPFLIAMASSKEMFAGRPGLRTGTLTVTLMGFFPILAGALFSVMWQEHRWMELLFGIAMGAASGVHIGAGAVKMYKEKQGLWQMAAGTAMLLCIILLPIVGDAMLPITAIAAICGALLGGSIGAWSWLQPTPLHLA